MVDRRQIGKFAWASSIGTSALTISAGSPLTTFCKKSRWNCSVPTHTPTFLLPCRITVRPVVSIVTRCSSVSCSGLTPSASRACDFLRFSEMPSTPRRFCSHSTTFPIAAISRESSGGRMTVISSMNETVLAPGTGGLALNSLRIFSEPALYQSGPRLYPCCTPRADSTANRSFGGSRAYKFDA